MKQIKLEVGKTYINLKGEEVKIVEKNSMGAGLYKGSDGEWYTESGRWQIFDKHPNDLIEEVTRHTFTIPDGMTKLTVEQVSNRIIVEMVPEKGPKPGCVMVNEHKGVYIFKSVAGYGNHNYYAWVGKSGRLSFEWTCAQGRPATPEEAKLLFDALKKDGKRWNAETMEVEEIPEIDRIREWVEENLDDGYYNKEGIADVISYYLDRKENEKRN